MDGSGNQLYNPDTSDWDVVFAQLASPSPSSNSTPINIAGAGEASSWAPGDENTWATGWGTTTSGGASSDTLREVNIDRIADATCGSGMSYGGEFHPETMLCAGEILGGQDTCQGDSGGPLVTPIGGGTFRLIGDTSWGIGCALPNLPGVYGRVAQDPLCSSLRNGIQTVAGADVVGAGGCLAGPSGGAGFVSPTPPGGGTPADTLPPQVQITKGPKNKTKKRIATFEFTGSDTRAVASFQCSLDNAAFADCSSPFKVSVKTGKHRFQVRAVDQAGNVGSPASDDWKRKKKKKRK